jgi:predicted DNA-binding transcriptional regulator AlpA
MFLLCTADFFCLKYLLNFANMHHNLKQHNPQRRKHQMGKIIRTRKQLAEYLNCSVSSTYRWEKEGALDPPRKHGKSSIWITDELHTTLLNCPLATSETVRSVAPGTRKGRPAGSLNKKTLAAQAA